ncbi:hypothetical protein L228DRAFT_247260 [Xylona heveae TC161]|uniref:Uncharacterized protein n=1 Tax=Xylona heveae (strain CBS 132557 / TC161) TaxID=1328760 RepID=A0A165H1A1_XYLHT|nr:hypothetical protein L228DRAFT_247260 [Xylona heveae TC161]KZF22858.1 hypothetical protein L228DRAFT_247260 [Xylona heveae TC161]
MASWARPPPPTGATPESVRRTSMTRNSISSAASAYAENAENAMPTRHPKPLTPGELCLQMEQEQEAVVNRLTRELSSLRARSGSIASATSVSSTLTGPVTTAAGPGVDNTLEHNHNPIHSHHRSPSSISIRSTTAPTTAVPAAAVDGVSGTVGGNTSLSRQNSTASSRLSVPPSPLPNTVSPNSLHHNPFDHHNHHHTHHQPGPPTAYTQPRHASLPQPHIQHSPSLSHAATMQLRSYSISLARYEEAASHRLELEAAKHENMLLLRRIRELEQQLKDTKARHQHEQLQGHVPELHRNESTQSSGGIPLPAGGAARATAGPEE